MNSFSCDKPLNNYIEYLNNVAPSLKLDELTTLVNNVEQTNWEEPTSAFDLNNFAVITLIEAELTQDLSLRAFNTEIAIEALQQGSQLRDYPLCKAHLALVQGMLGEINSSRQIAYANLIESLQELYNSQKDVPLGLIYLPQPVYSSALLVRERLEKLLSAKDGQSQTLLFLTVESNNSDSKNFEEITCFTLDSLVEKEKLEQVNWLKIDAEGHETKVLEGSNALLNQFSPNILYENIAGNQGINIAIAEMLIEKGYRLFHYQPFLKQLLPINSLEDLSDQLNIIALPY